MKGTKLEKIEYPDKIGNGEWTKTYEKELMGLHTAIYQGNFLDIRNDSVEMSLIDERDSTNPYLTIVMELGDITLQIGDSEYYSLPIARGLNFNLPENYGILASKIYRALGFKYFDKENQKIKEDNEKTLKKEGL